MNLRAAGFAALIATLGIMGAPALGAESVLRVGLMGEPDTLDSSTFSIDYAEDIVRQLFTPLTEYRADGVLTAGAATSWSVTPDGKTFRFVLRRDMVWSDGKPMTAEDWVYSFRRLMLPATLATRAPQFYEIAGARAVNAGTAKAETLGVAAIDAATLEIKLATPNPLFPAILSTFYPAPRQAIEAYGTQWVTPAHYIGNGPYKLVENTPHVGITLVRNPKIPADLAGHYDRLHVAIITDQAQSLQRFVAGDLDVVAKIWPVEYKKVPPKLLPQRHSFPAGVSYFLGLNTRRGPLSDIRVRKALSLAIDRDLVARQIVGAEAVPVDVLVPGVWTGLKTQYAPPDTQKPLAERRALAKSLLAAAGYGPQKRPAVEIVYAGTMRQRISIVLQAMWQAIGVDAQIRSSEVTAMYASLNGGDYSIGIAGNDMGQIRDPNNCLVSFLHGGQFDFARQPQPEFVAALAKATAEPDAAKRQALMAEAERVLLSVFDVVPLYAEPTYYLIKPDVAGWKPGWPPLNWRNLRPAAPGAP